MISRASWRTASCVALAFGSSTMARADVDPDCFETEFSITCHKDRVGDATLLDQLAQPILAAAGWSRGCYRVSYVKGDKGRPDSVVVGVDGLKGSSVPACQRIDQAALTDAEARSIQRQGGGQKELMKAISDKTVAKGKKESASSAELMALGRSLKKAVLAADPDVRSRLLRKTNQIVLGSGFGGEARLALP
jgi:hypothetical protein